MKAILQWVLRTMMKDQTGIVRTMPKKDLVDFNVAMTVERLLRNGIDPNSLKNANQVENAINQIEAPKNVQQGIKSTQTAKVFDMEGKEIKNPKNIMGGKEIPDDDLPPPGSRGEPDDIAAPVQSAEETIKNMIEAENKKNINKIKERLKDKPEPEDKADGGRIGYKKGSVDLARRGFMKAAAGVGAGLGALKMGALKLFGKESTRQVTKQIIKTDNVPGKPEWFDALVTKVINQGEDVTKRFATQERQTVHKLEIDSFKDSKGNKVSVEEVRVTQDADTGEIRVEYLTPDSPGESQVDLVYKKPKPDESDPNPSAEFYAVESEPRVVNFDGDIEFDGENLVDNVDDLMTDTTKLKILAKGDAKPTLKEFVESKKKKDQVERLNRDQMNQVDYIETKYGPGPDPSDYEDFARGGIAGMLGE